MAYATGKRIVEMVNEDLRPSDIMTRPAFENAIRVVTALGASSNCVWHLIAIARHMGVELTVDDWQTCGDGIPLVVNMQPAGKYLGEAFHKAGGVPAVMRQLLDNGKLDGSAMTVSGRTVARQCRHRPRSTMTEVIYGFDTPMMQDAGYAVLRGNFFDTAVMKISVIGDDFPRQISEPPRRREYSASPRHRVRRVRRLSRPDQRSGAEHRRRLHAVHPRHRTAGLARLGRGRETCSRLTR